jgi:hypothetical protein
MNKGADIVSSIQHLKMADEHMSSFIRDMPGTVIARLFKNYRSKIDWMLTDIRSNPQFPQVIRDGIRKEINSDVFQTLAINEKFALLPIEQRDAVELLIDKILEGEELRVVNDTEIQTS